MDFSAANHGLWDVFVWGGVIAALLLVANLLTRKVGFIRKSLMPVAALAGFILLALRATGLLKFPAEMLEMVTYHGIAIGFIAMSLRTTKTEIKGLFAFKSGALIVSTYLVQAVVGLAISALLYFTLMPALFPASGILLPMAYGQGPGQANNVGSTYEALGFIGGRSFGLSLAAAGYLTACLVGIWYTQRVIKKRGAEKKDVKIVSGSVVTEVFQEENEVPLDESVDRLSLQIALIMITYLITFLITRLITGAIAGIAPGAGKSIVPLFWGFNFITGSLVAMGTRGVLSKLRKSGVMTRQYQNNYLLNRISGLAFDLMIVAGIASIDISDLQGLWVPFLLMAVIGGIVTYIYLKWIVPRLSPTYADESFIAIFGMLTGTISSGILPLRQIDPEFKTPAADQLVVGSGTGILFGAPILILVGLAPNSTLMLFVTIALCAIYLAALVWFMVGKKFRKNT
ncbi:MAG: hypothetical protein GX171_00780 [Clostridiales bacterium]|jgi:ESS family glutamate:Na+ symporter|nr:hypothetical protein [Clostridiales bacterium]